MIIKDFELFQFQLPLRTPLKIANKEILSRKGLILNLTDDKNNIGLGEISPLPGLHKENLFQTIEQTKEILSHILNQEIPYNLERFNGGFEAWLSNFNLHPSVQFGFESAILTLFAANKGISTIDLFSSSNNNSILINALLTGTSEQIIAKTNQYLIDGFTVFKLKVGRNRIEEDIELVNTVLSLIDEKACLRLDANQAWDINDALNFFQNIDVSKIEFIEEPLKNYTELQYLLDKINIPIALDENILEFFGNQKISPSKINAIIIKPTRIGGVEKSIQLIRFAEKNGIMPVISDTFQSGVGLSLLISIASSITDRNIAMGFDTYSWLKQDILNERLQFRKAKILINNLPEIATNINYSILSKI